MLKSFAVLALLTSATFAHAPSNTLAAEAGLYSMRADYAPLTCASLHIDADCYDTRIGAMEAQVAIAAYEGDTQSVEYYSAVLACYKEIGVSILCEDD